MIAIRQPRDDLVGGLLPREVEEELLDILDFQSPLVEPVLLQQIFYGEEKDYIRLYWLKPEQALGFGL